MGTPPLAEQVSMLAAQQAAVSGKKAGQEQPRRQDQPNGQDDKVLPMSAKCPVEGAAVLRSPGADHRFREGAAHLQQKGGSLEGVLCASARREELWDQWWVDNGLLWRRADAAARHDRW